MLVVDDDDAIRTAVAEALEMEGYAVSAASNGAEALALVRQQQPSAVVLDLMMPVMDGWQFLEHCRADALCQDTPVVVISAYRNLPAEAGRLGVKGCITKPFDLDVLLGAVERVMERGGAAGVP